MWNFNEAINPNTDAMTSQIAPLRNIRNKGARHDPSISAAEMESLAEDVVLDAFI